MQKNVQKGILFWGSITIVTFLLTYFTCVSNVTTEEVIATDELTIAYEGAYNNAIEAMNLLEQKKYLEIQDKIDAGRADITKIKSLVEAEAPESIDGNTWSVILDNTQGALYNVVIENIEKIKTLNNSEEKSSLKEETGAIIDSLKNSSIEKTKLEGERLEGEFNENN